MAVACDALPKGWNTLAMLWNALATVILAMSVAETPAAANPHGPWGRPEAVAIEGYAGHAMEPFISCDGKVLLFNDRNSPSDQTDLHWAESVTDIQFRYSGRIKGANGDALDAVPSMDCQGDLFFVSTRTYFQTRSTIYRARFNGGSVRDARVVPGLATAKIGLLIFDAEISPDGASLYAAEGTYDALGGPWSADLFLAERNAVGFSKSSRSSRLLAKINTDQREYAPSLSHDGLELFFTRLSGWSIWPTLTIEHATRNTATDAWGPSRTIASITGFVEAPSVSRDGRRLYFHMKMEDGMHRIFLVRRN